MMLTQELSGMVIAAITTDEGVEGVPDFRASSSHKGDVMTLLTPAELEPLLMTKVIAVADQRGYAYDHGGEGWLVVYLGHDEDSVMIIVDRNHDDGAATVTDQTPLAVSVDAENGTAIAVFPVVKEEDIDFAVSVAFHVAVTYRTLALSNTAQA